MKRKMEVPIAEIARRAGVSNATVSRVLNNTGVVRAETCKRVYAVLESLHIDVEETILTAPPAGKLILFNLPFDLNPFFNEIFQGAKTSAQQHGYNILINQEHVNANTHKKLERMLRDLKVAGVIFLNHIEPEYLDRLLALVPIVQCCDCSVRRPNVSSVGVDDFKAARVVMDYIYSLGCRRVAFLSTSLKYSDMRNRKLGYLQSLKDRGIEPLSPWIVQLPEVNYDMALSVATQILSHPIRPDAFFAAADILSIAVVNAARSLNIRVPEDLVVVGYDNTEYSRISNPAITTMNHSKFQVGFSTCELLVEKIRNPQAVAQHISLPTELVIRASSQIRHE